MMEIILEDWWKFILIIISLSIAAHLAGKTIIDLFREINTLFNTLSRELTLRTRPKRGAIVNIIMLLFAGLLALSLVIPNALAQLGLQDNENIKIPLLGIGVFLATACISGLMIHSFESELPAFTSHELEESPDSEQSE